MGDRPNDRSRVRGARPNSGSEPEQLAAGRAALAKGAWHEARRIFDGLLAHQEAPEALEGLSWATWWLEDVEACLDARERAFRGYRRDGDDRSAARMALWLGDDHVEFRNADAVAEGWTRRAARLLAELPPCPEHGWLTLFEAHATLARGDLPDARALAERARHEGHRHRTTDLEMFALATEGVALVRQGRMVDGLRALDEATAAALAGEFENLAPAAWTCCLMMSTCERLRDHARAAQWCERIDRFSAELDVRFLTGVCRTHLGVIAGWQGRWERAERELLGAVDTLTTDRPSWRAEAVVRLGQLRRRQGRRSEAAALFDEAPDHPIAVLGQASLALERGEVDTARELAQRVLRRCVDDDRAHPADALELLARIHIAAGSLDAAADAVGALRDVARTAGTEALRAATLVSDGLLDAAHGAHVQAAEHLADAADLFLRCGAPVDAARARLERARALIALDRRSAAMAEARHALSHLAGVAAAPEHDDAQTLLAGLRDTATGADRDEVLTTRQVEVLRLIADGLSDQEIAERLVLSRHTVHRHVANIYTRLGCSTRPAAVAAASRRGLL